MEFLVFLFFSKSMGEILPSLTKKEGLLAKSYLNHILHDLVSPFFLISLSKISILILTRSIDWCTFIRIWSNLVPIDKFRQKYAMLGALLTYILMIWDWFKSKTQVIGRICGRLFLTLFALTIGYWSVIDFFR